MPHDLVDLRLFRYASAAAEHGSFRRAAVALSVEQSSVSKGVRSLEYRIGAPLFERSHVGVRPTLAGERFLQEATRAFDQLDRAIQRAGAVQRGEHGELTVAASVPFRLMGDVLQQFRDAHQGISVEMVEVTCNGGLTLVQQRKADIAFVTKAPADGISQAMRLRTARLKVVLPKSHRLAQASAVTLEEIRQERFIFSAGGVGPEVRDFLVGSMAKTGIEPELQLHRVGLYDLINMVARGFGITVAIGEFPSAEPDHVVLIPLAGRSAIGIHAVWTGANSNPALSGLLDIVQAYPTPRHTA